MKKKFDIVLWGAGLYGKNIYRMLDNSKVNVVAWIDNDSSKWGQRQENSIIISAENLAATEFDYLIITPEGYRTQIKEQCFRMGIIPEKIVDYWDITTELTVDFIDTEERMKYEAEQKEIRKEREVWEKNTTDKIQIASAEQLLKELLSTKKSLSRFGDGEFELMQEKKRSWFQCVDENLARRLREIITSDQNNVLIAVADNFCSLERYTEEAAKGIAQYMSGGTRERIISLLDKTRVYYDAYVSRPYMIYKDKEYARKIFGMLEKLWAGKRLFIVEGEASRMGIGNNLFAESKGIRRLIAPPQNAFEKYDEIFQKVCDLAEDDELILISLGPTATVLAYDLGMVGKRAIDIGQIDNEYDWYCAKAEVRIPIEGKAITELSWCRTSCDTTEEFKKQVVAYVK